MLRVRLTIDEIPTMSGSQEVRSAASRSNVENVQSKTLVSTPERAQLTGEHGDAERRKEHLGGHSGAKVGKDQRYPGHAVPRVLATRTLAPASTLARAPAALPMIGQVNALRHALRTENARLLRSNCRTLPGKRTTPGVSAHVKPLRNEVLLVFPGRFKAPDPQVPLQLLHVAGALQRAGYDVRISDMRLHDYRSLTLGDPVFVGLTCMSGPQIRYGLEFARKVRAESPRTTIVWGGVHPTLLPEQTAASALVDVVVRGESEEVVGPLADRLAAGAPLDDVKGLTTRRTGRS